MRNRIRALIVDDDKIVMQGMLTCMPWNEYAIDVAGDVNSAAAALAFMEREPVDLLITDLVMPVMNGIELIQRARALYPDMWIVVLSFHQDFDYVREALRLGVIDYILKTQLERDQVGEVLERIRNRIDSEQERASNRHPHSAQQQVFYHRKCVLVYPKHREAAMKLLGGEPIRKLFPIYSVGEGWLLDAFDEEPPKPITELFAQLLDCAFVIVDGLKGADVQRALGALEVYINRHLFYDYDGGDSLFRLDLAQADFSAANTSDVLEREIMARWSSVQWAYLDMEREALIATIRAARMDAPLLKRLFFALTKEWERSLMYIGVAMRIDWPTEDRFWRDWERWLVATGRRIQDKTQKPVYSQDIISSIIRSIEYIQKTCRTS